MPALALGADSITMHLLQHGEVPEGTSALEKSRASKRLKYYAWRGGNIYRLLPDGTQKQVPPPKQRQHTELIRQFHETCRHFGIRPGANVLLVARPASRCRVVSGCAAAVGFLKSKLAKSKKQTSMQCHLRCSRCLQRQVS